MKNMQKILFFEGVDKTGKTSISKKLSEIIGIPYFKNNTEKKFFSDIEVAKYRWLDQLYLQQFLEQTKYSAIIDRGFISDIVYTMVFRKHILNDVLDNLKMVDELFAKIGAKIIYCYKDNHALKDDIVDTSFYNDIANAYGETLNMSKCNVLILNTTNEDLESQICEVIKWLML